MSDDQVANNQSTAILKELSDIKSSLAVNTTETANIKTTIGEIKGDIREIKADFVSRREFTDTTKDVGALKKQMDDLRYWQAKTIGYATGASTIVYYLIRYLTKSS